MLLESHLQESQASALAVQQPTKFELTINLSTACNHKAAQDLIADDKQRSRRIKAIAALSTLVGAVSMARAVNDDKLSREILKSAADELKARLG